MPLTDTAIRKAKPAAKPLKMSDGGGLYLLLRPDGARWWRWDYRRPVTGNDSYRFRHHTTAVNKESATTQPHP